MWPLAAGPDRTDHFEVAAAEPMTREIGLALPVQGVRDLQRRPRRDPGAAISKATRRDGLTPQRLFTWRREARKAAEVGRSLYLLLPLPNGFAKRSRRQHRRAESGVVNNTGSRRLSRAASPASK